MNVGVSITLDCLDKPNMLFDVDIYGGTGSAAGSNTAGAVRVSDQGSKPDTGITAAAREVGGQERVPDRPPVLTIDTFLDWLPKYSKQCIEDGRQRAWDRSSAALRNILTHYK